MKFIRFRNLADKKTLPSPINDAKQSNSYNPSLHINKSDEVDLSNSKNKTSEQQSFTGILIKKLKRVVSGLKEKSNPAKPTITHNSSANDSLVKSKAKTSSQVIEGLKKAIDKIPNDKDKKIEFLKKLFQTDLKTGVQNPVLLAVCTYWEAIAQKLADYDNDDLSAVLEYGLKSSEIFNMGNIQIADLNKDIKLYRNIKKRNILELIEQRKAAIPNESIHSYIPMSLGELDDTQYNSIYNILQKIGINDKDVQLAEIINFALQTSQDTIDYMLENDLFEPENMQSFEYEPEAFTKNKLLECFTSLSKETVERMHKRGLLKKMPERKEPINFSAMVTFADMVSDKNWERVTKRELLKLKTKDGKFLNTGEIIDLVKLSDETFSKIESRGILDKVGSLTSNIKNLAELNDSDWQKIQDRGVKIDRVSLKNKKSLDKLLSISDDDWKKAQKRGLTFQNNDDYKLLELSDKNWDNLIKRNLNAKFKTRNAYDADSQIRLSELTDAEFETAKNRGLIKENQYGKQFSEESAMLAKLNDSDYSLYIKRGIDKINDISVGIKQELFNMTDEQYKRVINDIIPLINKYKEKNKSANKDADISEHYKLAYLSKDEYESAKEFLSIPYLGDEFKNQFNADEIIKIISFPSDRIERLRNIFSSSNNSDKDIKYSKATLLKFLEFDSDTFNQIISTQKFLSIHQIDNYIQKNMMINIIDSKPSDKIKELISKVNSSKMSYDAQDELVNRLLGFRKNDYSKINLREKMKQIKILQEAKTSKIFEDEEENYLNLDSEISKLQDSVKHVIVATNTSKEDIIKMMKGFFANNNPQLDDLLSTADFGKYGEEGLPLAYPRKDFIKDLSYALQDLSENKQAEILKKLGITLYKTDETIKGYDGIIDLSKLKGEGVEGDILEIATRFIKKNSVKTGNIELDKALNSLIKGIPEFLNIIGKPQHGEQSYSLDIHILNVLKESMANPNYKNLNNEEKFCLKFACLLHDIAKPDGIKDENHAPLCALYARDILNKDNIQMPEQIKDRIFELINNHHWLAEYNTGIKDANSIAVLFRRSGDINIARIMTEADIKSIDSAHKYYNEFKSALEDSMQLPVDSSLSKIDSNGQMFLTNKIIDVSKIKPIEYNGKKYKVIDFTQLNKNFDLSQFGFEPGTTVDNFRLFIHTVNEDSISNLENVYHLADPSNQGFLCATYISLQDKNTFADNKFGVSLTSENVNIANAATENQNSGRGKNLMHFTEFVTNSDYTIKYRTLIPDKIKTALNITDDEYSELFAKIQKYKYSSQLDNVDTITAGNKIFTGKQIKQAIFDADELMITTKRKDTKNNEANLYTPKINAVIAKVNSIKEIPQELLDFSQKHDLPVYILGE